MASKEENQVWGIHNMSPTLFFDKNVIALGWEQMGDLSLLPADRDAYKEKYKAVYPEASQGNVNNGAGMLYRFCHEAKIGDYVVYPSKKDRMINIGQIECEYQYDSFESEYVQQRKVKWLKQLPRLEFSQSALYEVGSALSFFAVKTNKQEFLDALNGKHGSKKAIGDFEDSFTQSADETLELTKDYILDTLSKQLKGYDLEDFVADLLNAMGYRTTVSPHGGDSGIDITAYKDELPPRIVVQVKSTDGDIKENTIQSLKGAMREGDYGLFVTLSKYTCNAQKYLDNTPMIRGINGNELADLILKYYEQLSPKYRKLIPLKKVYMPVFGSDEE